MRKYIVTLPLLLILASCGPADLTKVAQGLDALATATQVAQQSIIQMEAQKTIDTDTTRNILGVFLKVNLAQKQAISITRNLTKIDKPTQTQLIAIMQPITDSVKELVANGTAGIKNETTKQQVLLVITSVQAVITTIDLALKGN